MAQFKYCWELLIIYFSSLVFFFGSHHFSTSAILVSFTDQHDSPQLFILSGCSPLPNLFHIYPFHILLLSLPSHLYYLELSARSSFPKWPQFPPFHASPGVGSWGIRSVCAVLVWAAVCPPFPGWLQVSWHTEHCSPGCACIQAKGISPLWPVENFHSNLVFLNLLSSVKVEVQLMNSRGVLEARWSGKMAQCLHVNLVFIQRLKRKCSQHECVKIGR